VRAMVAPLERYPKPKLKSFLEEVFSAWGCKVSRLPGGLEVQLTPSLRKKFRRPRLSLHLARGGASRRDGRELMVPGNPVFRAILDLARSRGAVGRGYAPMPKRRPAASTVARSVAKALKIEGGAYRTLVREEQYHPLLLFHFNVSYGVPEVPDEIRAVVWDTTADEATDGTLFGAEGLSLGADPVPGVECLRPGDIDTVFEAARSALEAQISRKVARTETRARKKLEREKKCIEGFYRRMIEEEKSRPRSKNGDTDLSRRIEVYQLDWKRKLSEATERLRPRVSLRLFCVEEAYLPRRKVALLVPEAGRLERDCFYDYHTRKVLGPRCDSCGHRSLEMSVCKRGHLCCPTCLRLCETSGGRYCPQCWAESYEGGDEKARKEADPSAMMAIDPGSAGIEVERKRRGRG